jgi:hypothetical protein
VPPPPVEGAPIGTGLGDGLGELITTGAVVVAGTVTGDVDADADADADALAEELEPGATAVKKLPLAVGEELPDADAPPGVVHAVVAASRVRAPQLIAASLAPECVRASAVRTPMEPPGTGAP